MKQFFHEFVIKTKGSGLYDFTEQTKNFVHKNKLLNGIIFSSAGSFWWGIIGVFYFKHVSFAGPVELVIHRTIWTAFILLLSITLYSRWYFFFEVIKSNK